VLADINFSLAVGRARHDDWLAKIEDNSRTAEEAVMVKLWMTENNGKVVDQSCSFAGYMSEYPISRLYVDSRARKIFGGSSDVCRMTIGRSL
jgi:long-chain-acyl-CoA dehydrogenase